MGEAFTETEIEDCFEKMDADEDGEVSYEEFLAATVDEFPEVW